MGKVLIPNISVSHLQYSVLIHLSRILCTIEVADSVVKQHASKEVCGRLHFVTSGCVKYTALVCLLLRSPPLSRAYTHFNAPIKIPCTFVESCSQGELQIETARGAGGTQVFNHCDKCGRGRLPSVPLRMRQTHWLNSHLSALNSRSSLFYFYFTLSLLLFCLVFITLCFLCSLLTFTLLILLYLSYCFLSDLSHPVLSKSPVTPSAV